jgi:sirohydrochlorin cobaltochelatase
MRKIARKLGVLLVGHGTKNVAGTTQFLALASQLSEELSPTAVEPAFLELQTPNIADGARRIVERGATDIVVAPLLLFGAGHTKRDIPLAVKSSLLGLPRTSFKVAQAAHLGSHHAMATLSRLRFSQACEGKSAVPAEQTALVLVGRGSLDASATAEMHEFARLRHQPDAACETIVGFLAMAQPSLAEVLAIAASRGFRRVVVQPHLLFAGELADTIEREVRRMQAAHPDQEWLATPLLADSQDSPSGGNQFLLRAMSDRIRSAIRVVAPGPEG